MDTKSIQFERPITLKYMIMTIKDLIKLQKSWYQEHVCLVHYNHAHANKIEKPPWYKISSANR